MLEGNTLRQPLSSPSLNSLPSPLPIFPLQAPPEDIARYRKTYLAGWDVMREERWQRFEGLAYQRHITLGH